MAVVAIEVGEPVFKHKILNKLYHEWQNTITVGEYPFHLPEHERESHRLFMQNWRRENRERVREIDRDYRARLKAIGLVRHLFPKRRNRVSDQKRREERLELARQTLGGRCQHCGNDNKTVLDFHHKYYEEGESRMNQSRKVRVEGVLSKPEKYMLLCANCHRIEHARLRRAHQPEAIVA